MARILVVDDEKKMRHILSIMLQGEGHVTQEASDGEAAWKRIEAETYDMAIVDMKMPGMDGMGLLDRIRKMNIPCPVVFITAFATVDSAVEAMRRGAVDYITKPFEQERIRLTVEKALSLSRIMAENLDLRHELREVFGENKIVYRSQEMASAVNLSAKVAKRESAVLVTGESGTGKELIARFIHESSPRCDGRFVAVNCAAIPNTLVESELFGHEKGAFTGADRKKKGKLEAASGGTLFLDEIGDLSLEAQAKLLRALEEKKVLPLGGNRETSVSVRVICATNQDLAAMVQRETFREDLFYRINVVPVHLVPLRERVDDIAVLAEHFIRRFKNDGNMRLTEGARNLLKAYHWPGNVRELANAMERALILGGAREEITAEALGFLKTGPGLSLQGDNDNGFRLPPEGVCLETLEGSLVCQALELSGNNQSAAARLLGLSRAKFRVLMKQARRMEDDEDE